MSDRHPDFIVLGLFGLVGGFLSGGIVSLLLDLFRSGACR